MGGLVLALLLVLIRVVGLRARLADTADAIFRRVQFVSASLYALGHGGNDAQKTMGSLRPCSTLMVNYRATFTCRFGSLSAAMQPWRSARCWAAGASFTPWVSRITHLTPLQGVCAETAGSITLFCHLARRAGIDDSHDHWRHRRRRRGAARFGGALGFSARIVIAWMSRCRQRR